MESTSDTDQRLTELEIKASYSEDLLEQLNMALYRQQLQIDALLQELKQMRQQQSYSSGGTPRNLRDELPPHY
ncbi:SlyX family protein [Simplicispira psychrophila]|uniref:SlyX family protein n=1 Tax=Simplicispira psychrophila TaxID=80882 RepID=UPI0004899A0D|nr:SlyX family protein [Simplicispira psychrophila]